MRLSLVFFSDVQHWGDIFWGGVGFAGEAPLVEACLLTMPLVSCLAPFADAHGQPRPNDGKQVASIVQRIGVESPRW
jgi:hypothetical protein